MTRTDRKKQVIKEKLFNCAMELFLTQGYDKTTVSEITQKADVGKGTFFNYFPKKVDILNYIGDRNTDDFKIQIDDGIQNKQKVKTIMEHIMDLITARGQKYHAVLHDAIQGGSYYPRLSNNRAVEHEVEGIITRFIQYGQSTGELRSSADTELVSHLLLSLYSIAIIDYISTPVEQVNQNTLSNMIRSYLEVIFRGISNE